MNTFRVFVLMMSSGIATNILHAQDIMVISGKVLDQTTHEPIPYVTIGIRGHAIGSVSNSVGEFEFFIQRRFLFDSLFVSHVGYKTFEKSISRLVEGGPLHIYLEESPLVLNEIIVAGKKITAKEIVQQALESIPNVYPVNPYLLEGFHRSWEKVEFIDSLTYPGTLVEAAVSIYDPAYLNRKDKKEEIFLKEVRRSNLMRGWNYGNGNFLRMLLRENDVRYNKSSSFVGLLNGFLNFPNEIVYEYKGTTQLDGENVYVIRASVPNKRDLPAFYLLYISEKDFAILRYELNGLRTEIDSTSLALKEWHPLKIEHIYIFKRLDNKPYLSYAKIQYQIEKSERKTMEIVRREEYFCELLINNVVPSISESQYKDLGTKAKEISFALQAGDYNKEFWKSYNIIRENPLDTAIVSWFEKQEKLERQFSKPR